MLRFTTDKCSWCGLPSRKHFESIFDDDFLDNNGTFYETLFWFCSNNCCKNAIESLIEKRFRRPNTPYDDPDLPNEHIEEFVESWCYRQEQAITKASGDLLERALAEHNTLVRKLNADYDKNKERKRQEATREAERMVKEEERKREKQQALARQEMNDRERRQRIAKIDEQRELDRQERLRKEADKEAEKQRKLEEAEKARREEEERWKPRPFKL